ncbi:DUF4136 domain-containing protein [Saccharicrinis aurantiacus]|uniref:DUF4136 domain-containing protein n=1 Tax=Saccharicrinis aurantiacus TaxID=1849719 RepID=UPI00094FA90A|nr:DUF4136 domain-containing protein [Saccharicrinis aurantiacus]
MTVKQTLFIALIASLLASCSGIKVVTNYDKETNFDQYSTARYFGWKNNSDDLLTDMEKKYIETAFHEEFTKRDITFIDDTSSDLIVSLFIVTEKKSNYSQTATYPHAYRGYYRYGYGGYYGYGPGYGWGGAYPYGDIQVVEYTEGTLIVSVYDAKKKEIIWESVASGTIEPKSNRREEQIKYSVGKIMYKFPKKIVKKKK